MLVPIQSWTQDFVRRLLEDFPGQVVFVGLQGSYRRGEATGESDIDMVTVLERVGPEELRIYRDLVRSLPFGERACGFLCGREELSAWPPFDLLQLVLDTRPLYGSIQDLGAFSAADLEEAVRVGASALYHAAVHSYLYAPRLGEVLPGLEKSLFFLIRLEEKRRTGRWPDTRREAATLAGPLPEEAEARCAQIVRLASSYLKGSVPS